MLKLFENWFVNKAIKNKCVAVGTLYHMTVNGIITTSSNKAVAVAKYKYTVGDKDYICSKNYPKYNERSNIEKIVKVYYDEKDPSKCVVRF